MCIRGPQSVGGLSSCSAHRTPWPSSSEAISCSYLGVRLSERVSSRACVRAHVRTSPSVTWSQLRYCPPRAVVLGDDAESPVLGSHLCLINVSHSNILTGEDPRGSIYTPKRGLNSCSADCSVPLPALFGHPLCMLMLSVESKKLLPLLAAISECVFQRRGFCLWWVAGRRTLEL